MGSGQVQFVLGSFFVVFYIIWSEGRKLCYVNEVSDVVKFNKVFYKMKIKIVQICFNV